MTRIRYRFGVEHFLARLLRARRADRRRDLLLLLGRRQDGRHARATRSTAPAPSPSCGRGAGPPPPRPCRTPPTGPPPSRRRAFSATLPISSQFWWSFVSASTTLSAATSCAAIRSASLEAISIALTSACALEPHDGPAGRLHLGIEADPRERLAQDLLVGRRLVEVLPPLLLEIGVLGAADRGLVDRLPADLGLERLVQQFVDLRVVHGLSPDDT